ncbi:MAG: LacI family DNA-binding transcriptional regulator [Beutenbergiaceae bacterium]
MSSRVEVAKLAGVTPAVVSYVLNGNRPVSKGTRAKVLAAIDELDYRPNALARSLAMARSNTLGVLVPDSSNPFFAELATAIEDAAFDRGLIVLLGNTVDNRDRELTYVRTFLDRKVDGLIICPSSESGHLMPELDRSGVPVVFTDRAVGLSSATRVLVDNEQGAYEATQHLVEHGHRRIGCISGPEPLLGAMERLAGWRRAVAEAGSDPADELCRNSEFDSEGGYQAMHALIADQPDLDAVFVSSDFQAIGALRALSERNLSVGTDIALTSFDGIGAGEYAQPRLTTSAQPFQEVANQTLAMLAHMMDHPAAPAAPPTVLPTTLVRRESCGCTQEPPAPDGPDAGTGD